MKIRYAWSGMKVEPLRALGYAMRQNNLECWESLREFAKRESDKWCVGD